MTLYSEIAERIAGELHIYFFAADTSVVQGLKGVTTSLKAMSSCLAAFFPCVIF